jgi:hypothetical protein
VRFADVSKEAGPSFQAPAAHRGVAFGDFNNDGKIDAVVVVQNAKPEIWMNRSPGANHWLILNLQGTRSNRDGLGARVKITPNVGGPQWNHATTATGFSTSSDKRVHFGLGAATETKSRSPGRAASGRCSRTSRRIRFLPCGRKALCQRPDQPQSRCSSGTSGAVPHAEGLDHLRPRGN